MSTSFGDEIRRRRLSLGLTLEQLAEQSGLTPNYIGTIENSKRDPSLSTIECLARGLRVTVGELFGATPNLSSIGEEIGRYSDQLPQETQLAFLSILRALVNPKKRRG